MKKKQYYTQVKIKEQGLTECRDTAYIDAIASDVVALEIMPVGSSFRLYPIWTCQSVTLNNDEPPVDYPSIGIEDDRESSTTDLSTVIYFPQFKGWRVHSVSGGKILSVCLVVTKIY